MKCPFCHSDDIKVIDTRKFETCIRRVRLCLSCNQAFQTAEEIQLITPINIIRIETTKITK